MYVHQNHDYHHIQINVRHDYDSDFGSQESRHQGS